MKESDLITDEFLWLINELAEQDLLWTIGYSKVFKSEEEQFRGEVWEDYKYGGAVVFKDCVEYGETPYLALNQAYSKWLRMFGYWSKIQS